MYCLLLGDALDHLVKPLALISEAQSNKSLSDENYEDVSQYRWALVTFD